MENSSSRLSEVNVASYYVTIDVREYAVKFKPDGSVLVNDAPVDVDLRRQDTRTFSFLSDGSSKKVVAEKNADGYHLLVDGTLIEATIESERDRLLRAFDTQAKTAHKRTEVRAPMPALVVRVEVEVGQEVVAGQGLIILEAMKMENEIKASASGKVKEILVGKGKPVEKGERLIILE
ncbi:MAG: biotin/lipoyl-binding protein [Ignavibacteriae bacterium]|nr:biotin/lipoyl-binding protein [Ignavibacteriota bacterium]